MFGTIIPLVVGTVVSTSSGIAFDALTKLVTPPGVKALTGFGIKAGSAIVGAVVAAKISAFAVKQTENIVEIVRNSAEEIEAPVTES